VSGFGHSGGDEKDGSIAAPRMVAGVAKNRRRRAVIVQVVSGREDGLKGSVLSAGAVGRSNLLCFCGAPDRPFISCSSRGLSALSVLRPNRRKL